mmetsp:Transcript_33342/g.96318  ORF Transcript_33342/g.96318 Transcript_33342/m.96318 type:complete len:236 (+) Transcript_33342:1822-2529(+)
MQECLFVFCWQVDYDVPHEVVGELLVLLESISKLLTERHTRPVGHVETGQTPKLLEFGSGWVFLLVREANVLGVEAHPPLVARLQHMDVVQLGQLLLGRKPLQIASGVRHVKRVLHDGLDGPGVVVPHPAALPRRPPVDAIIVLLTPAPQHPLVVEINAQPRGALPAPFQPLLVQLELLAARQALRRSPTAGACHVADFALAALPDGAEDGACVCGLLAGLEGLRVDGAVGPDHG